jgi:beta-galactosidase
MAHIAAHSVAHNTQSIRIDRPTVWSPTSPHLSMVVTKIISNGKRLDEKATRFGIRTIEVSRAKGFVLNGKPLELIGTNRHQDYPWVGPALSSQANYRDAKLIKASGHNIVRLSHYPQSEEFLDACDELGILTIPCIAGWQFLNKDSRFKDLVERDIRELVQREASHPCVAWFETSLNETYPDNMTAKSWADAARSTIVGPNILLAGDAKPGAPWDIAYNQWKDEDFSRPQDAMPGKPGYIREYGDYEFGGTSSSSRVKIGQGVDAMLQETWNHIWSLNKLRPQIPWTMGYGTWEMFDHNVPYGQGVSASGLCDLFRMPKSSYWFYRSQAENIPFVKIVADWQPGTPTRQVVVFTNGDAATLRINGKIVAKQKPERGVSTRYDLAKSFDGSNTMNLTHPPIVFRNVAFEPGTLSVTIKRGSKMVTDELKTADRADHLKVWIDDQGVPMGRNDLVFVRASVVDKYGTVCPHVSLPIQFLIKGAKLAGEGSTKCEMGVASMLIRTPLDPASIRVSAKAQDLPVALLKFKIP